MNLDFWHGKRVFITGHTGFKGSWLSLWLQQLGADLTGYALNPPTIPSLFEVAGVAKGMHSIIADIRDAEALALSIREAAPDIVIHMAAQSLVRYSYDNPVETYATNVMGVVNLLEAIRQNPGVRAVVNVTTDKCYENKEWVWGYRENEPLGGFDPYSNSKGCSELVTSAYRNSYFNADKYLAHGVALASARAGNVIGGGDWALDRLIPDIINAITRGDAVQIRNPHAIRPWQHVLEPLSGYLMLAERLYTDGPKFAEAWNFGPREEDAQSVKWIVQRLVDLWGEGASWEAESGDHPHEANFLTLDTAKARILLGWQPRWSLDRSLESIIDWNRELQKGSSMRAVVIEQIGKYAGTP